MYFITDWQIRMSETDSKYNLNEVSVETKLTHWKKEGNWISINTFNYKPLKRRNAGWQGKGTEHLVSQGCNKPFAVAVEYITQFKWNERIGIAIKQDKNREGLVWGLSRTQTWLKNCWSFASSRSGPLPSVFVCKWTIILFHSLICIGIQTVIT
jgi:hypothetical protein